MPNGRTPEELLAVINNLNARYRKGGTMCRPKVYISQSMKRVATLLNPDSIYSVKFPLPNPSECPFAFLAQ
ncbi:hypothetical protein FMO003_34210 [Moritella sp. F3]|nr:hypothetical protein FMO001_43670 [Moritella sp. F1]GIC83141.1 hypothetical protein FMO003_34210 [Moritella sp. F3]